MRLANDLVSVLPPVVTRTTARSVLPRTAIGTLHELTARPRRQPREVVFNRILPADAAQLTRPVRIAAPAVVATRSRIVNGRPARGDAGSSVAFETRCTAAGRLTVGGEGEGVVGA